MPKSVARTLTCRKSLVRIVSWVMGISYDFPVRLSVIVTVSRFVPSASLDFNCVAGSAESMQTPQNEKGRERGGLAIPLYTKETHGGMRLSGPSARPVAETVAAEGDEKRSLRPRLLLLTIVVIT